MTADQSAGTTPAGIDYERFFELGVDVMVVTRPDGRFEMVNSAFSRLLGVDRATILSSPWTDFVHPDDRDLSVEENTREFEDDHRTMTFENRYVDSSGGVHWLDWNAELDTQTGLVYGTARDVTQQREARKALHDAYVAADEARVAAEQAQATAEAANNSKSVFMSRMSHELRTPMNTILGFSQLLEFDDLNDDQRDSVQQILRAGRHLLGLIDEVLDIARIEIGEISLSVEPIRVADTIAESLSLLGPLATARSTVLRSTHVDDVGAHVMADRRRLFQVLVNLLSNAIKYTPEGSTVRIESSSVADGWRRISVIDDGPGIEPHLVERLFNPFERIGAEATAIEGTGLGLAHSKALAVRMGGRVGVDSIVGQGSDFWIELPAAEGLWLDDEAGQARLLAPVQHVAGTLLYIEDNPANMQLLERVLEHRPGVRLRTAMLGRLGLDLARELQPDLIALDLHLPDISGETVLNELRADPRTADIPVVILSADATRRQIDHLMAIGAAHYLTKPLDITHLLTIVDGYFGSSEAGSS